MYLLLNMYSYLYFFMTYNLKLFNLINLNNLTNKYYIADRNLKIFNLLAYVSWVKCKG